VVVKSAPPCFACRTKLTGGVLFRIAHLVTQNHKDALSHSDVWWLVR
jgi:hypothetical protein